MTERYTAGFLFWREYVLLVKKDKPTWQAGLYNAIGGKVEERETPAACQEREFYEETGLALCWQHFAREQGRGYEVDFYRSCLPETPRRSIPPRNDVGELMSWVSLHSIGDIPCIGNLRWLIPMARDWRRLSATVVSDQDDLIDRPSW